MSVCVWINNYCSIPIVIVTYIMTILNICATLCDSTSESLSCEGRGSIREISLPLPHSCFIMCVCFFKYSRKRRTIVPRAGVYTTHVCSVPPDLFDRLILYVFDLRSSTMSNVVQYVLVRGDLTRTLKWPSGAVMAQACHACVAVVHTYYSDPDTQAYLKDLENMHKVILEVSQSPLVF